MSSLPGCRIQYYKSKWHSWQSVFNDTSWLIPRKFTRHETKMSKDCIPVGCVPPARWPYLPAGGWVSACSGECLPALGVGGMSARGGVCSQGWCLLQGVSAPRGRGCLLQGVSAPWRGCLPGGLLGGGVCSAGGVWYPSMHWGRHPPMWTESHMPVKT